MKIYIQPTIIMLSTRVDDEVDAMLQPEDYSAGEVHGRSEWDVSDLALRRKLLIPFAFQVPSVHLPYVLERRPSSEFNYEVALDKLIQLRVHSDDGPDTVMVMASEHDAGDDVPREDGVRVGGRQAKLLRLAGVVDLDSRVTVRST